MQAVRGIKVIGGVITMSLLVAEEGGRRLKMMDPYSSRSVLNIIASLWPRDEGGSFTVASS
jgi:hypothetical protein